MPPTTANYVQRAGRAGRRTDSAAFGFATLSDDEPRAPGSSRPMRVWASRVHFVSDDTTDHEVVLGNGERRRTVTLARRARGELVLVNAGRASVGYWICEYCGFGEHVG